MLGVAMADKPPSRTRYDRRAIPPAVVAFQAKPPGKGVKQLKGLAPAPPRYVTVGDIVDIRTALIRNRK